MSLKLRQNFVAWHIEITHFEQITDERSHMLNNFRYTQTISVRVYFWVKALSPLTSQADYIPEAITLVISV